MDAADARESVDRLALAPALRHLGPLSGTPVVRQVSTGADRVAIDESGGERTEFAAHRRGRGLVEQEQAAFDLTEANQRRPVEHKPEALEVVVAEASAEIE